MRNGAKPAILDKRDFSYNRTFGGISNLPLLDYNLDIGKTMPSQNDEGLPYGCTGYTQADISTNEDSTIYKPSYTYSKTCLMEGHDENQGCDIRNSIKSTREYGVQALSETTDEEAETHRRGAYFNIYEDSGNDWFDSFRNALRNNKRPISIGTPWFREWALPQNGVIPTVFTYDGNPGNYPWHNYEICGERNLGGTPYLIAKTWQGTNYGDHGWCYFPRQTINAAMEIRGSIAFTFAKALPGDIYSIKIDILEQVLNFLYRLIGLKRLA